MQYLELAITVRPDARDRLIELLTEKGSLGFIEHENGLTAYFPESSDNLALIRELEVMRSLLADAGVPLSFTSAMIAEQDWNESWKKGFTRLDVGNSFSILPPWEPVTRDRVSLIIDPGMAFGTGHHETTRSCLVLMERYDGRTGKDRFLDLGCGTGLLAIAAAKLGYRSVVAVDTDPLATAATRMNMGLNDVDIIIVRDGGIEQAEGVFDCIAANILSGVLVELAPDIAVRLTGSGVAILSGILAEQADEVIIGMKASGLKLLEKYPDDKWISLVMAR